MKPGQNVRYKGMSLNLETNWKLKGWPIPEKGYTYITEEPITHVKEVIGKDVFTSICIKGFYHKNTIWNIIYPIDAFELIDGHNDGQPINTDNKPSSSNGFITINAPKPYMV